MVKSLTEGGRDRVERRAWARMLRWDDLIRSICGRYDRSARGSIDDLIQESRLEVYRAFLEGRHRTTTLDLRSFVIFKVRDACSLFIRSQVYPLAVSETAYLDGRRWIEEGSSSGAVEPEPYRATAQAIRVLTGTVFLDDDRYGNYFGREVLESREGGKDLDSAVDLEGAMVGLSEREKFIVRNHFYYPCLTMVEIAALLGRSEYQIRRVRKRALRKMQGSLLEAYQDAS